jgi:hypothetical protein
MRERALERLRARGLLDAGPGGTTTAFQDGDAR